MRSERLRTSDLMVSDFLASPFYLKLGKHCLKIFPLINRATQSQVFLMQISEIVHLG